MRRTFFQLAVIVSLAVSPLTAETVPFSKAMDAALKHSGTMAIAAAEEAKARAGLAQARDAYIPQAIVGAGLGASFGFPLSLEGSAPSILNFNTSSMVLNFPQREYIRSARLLWQAASTQTLDKRDQVILDTATAYIELDQALSKLKSLKDQGDAAQHAEFITTERVNQGVDSQLDLKKAQLNSARVRMRLAEVQANVDVLRERLSRLTGIAAADFATDPNSLPKFPEARQDANVRESAVANSPAVKAADQKLHSQEAKARAEHKQWMPQVDFAAQYAMLARYNNYDQYYQHFQRNNASIGVNIRFPFYSASQRAIADAADADVIIAQKEDEQARNQVAENALKAQRTLVQLVAAADVARLEYEVTNTGVAAAQDRLDTGNTTARDVENAKVDAAERYGSYLDAQLELAKAQLQLLRMTGDIFGWALPKQ